MKLVVDANILFSFFKLDSTPRELMLDPELRYDLELFAPELVLKEVGKHRNEICDKFGLDPEDFDVMFSSLELFVRIVRRNVFESFFPMAKEALPENIKDIPYAALSFWFKDRGDEISIWSNDRGLKVLEKYGVKVFNTEELIKKLGLSPRSSS